jgi:hypothetical protein
MWEGLRGGVLHSLLMLQSQQQAQQQKHCRQVLHNGRQIQAILF